MKRRRRHAAMRRRLQNPRGSDMNVLKSFRLILAAALPRPCCSAVRAAAQTAIKFSLDFKFEGPAAPFLVAIDKGYFKAEGLDVTIDTAARLARADQPRRLRHLRHGLRRHQFADQVPRRQSGRRRSRPCSWSTTSRPSRSSAARAAASRSRRTSKARSSARPPPDGAYAQWKIFVQANGIDASKVKIENVGFPVREPMLQSGQVDAITGFSFSSFINLKDRGVPVDDIVVHADGRLRRQSLRQHHHREPEIRRREAGGGEGLPARLPEGPARTR